MILIDRTCDGWPRSLQDKNTLNVVTLQFLSGDGIQDRRLNSEEGYSGGSRLGLNRTREGRYHDGARLRLPESIHNRALTPSNVVVVPMPRLRVDGLSDGTEHTQCAEVMVLHVVFAETTKQTDSSWCRVELGELMLLHSLPVSGRCGVYWCRFEDGGGDAIGKRSVNDVATQVMTKSDSEAATQK